MKSAMLTVPEVISLIRKDIPLFIAADENALKQLPQGQWIGGTIPYFMTENGGLVSSELLQVTPIPALHQSICIKEYSAEQLGQISENYFKDGFSLIIIPAFSKSHEEFAKNSSTYKNIFIQPLVGWICGTNLNDQGAVPKVFNGATQKSMTDKALVMHISLPEHLKAEANIINIFEQGSSDSIYFEHTGFATDSAIVNGAKVKFSDYLKNKKIDLKLPLVADYFGAKVNVSFRDIQSDGSVRFYAPIFPDVEYKVASSIDNYEAKFIDNLKKHALKDVMFSCNCILNFLYANLEGKKAGDFNSAMTFGEIAYMLLNQTFVYVEIKEKH